MMKKIIYAFAALALAVGMTACDDDDKVIVIEPTGHGTVTDDQGNVYDWVQIGDLCWTTTNARNGAPLDEAEFFNNYDWVSVLESEEDIKYYYNEYRPAYGNLMTYADAMTSAPEGWRLPTDEDWIKLERAMGMKDADSEGLRGNIGLELQKKDSGSKLGLTLGGSVVPIKNFGWIEMNLDFVGAYGYYWTSTRDTEYTDQEQAYFRRVTANNATFGRNRMQTSSYLSVRWVKDAK